MLDVSAYIGVPFKKDGVDLNGWNCWTCVRYIYRERFGVHLPSYQEHYDQINEYETLSRVFDREKNPWIEIEKGREAEGDVALIRMRGFNIHVGLIVRPGAMLHVEEGVNTCIENYSGIKWKKRISGFYRHESLNQ